MGCNFHGNIIYILLYLDLCTSCIHTYCKTSKKFYNNVRRGMRGSISIRQRESARPIGNSLHTSVLPPTALLIATRFSANFDPKSEVFALISTKKINRVTRPIAPTPPSLSFVGLTLKCCATFSDKFWTVFRATCPHMYVHN